MAGFNTPSQLVSDAQRVKKNGHSVSEWLAEFSDWKLSRMLNLNACPAWLSVLIEKELDRRDAKTEKAILKELA